MIKLLLGGSPCTHWSIAQTNNRETEPSGVGWELFKNYLIAKEKFKPDFFLYENNKSAAAAIKNQISKELDVDLMYINSALVSAQNRQRFYCFNGECEQPEDRGILLQDIFEDGCFKPITYNVPQNTDFVITGHNIRCQRRDRKHSTIQGTHITFPNSKTQTLSVAHIPKAFQPIRLGYIVSNSQGNRIYDIRGKSICLSANGGGRGAKTGLYAIPVNSIKGNNIYEVKDGYITYKDKQYPIKLPDGYYIIRKLTPIECERLQTLPDNYTAGISDTQRYKCLGNGWTAEVIIHILRNILRDIPRAEKLLVLSMYDGIATGQYCLEQLGFTDIEYHAYEIDKYAKQIELKNYPDIIQHGDAFEVRNTDWRI